MTHAPGENRSTIHASLALAFASVGDAFLYPFLPVNHAAVGIPVVWIGILLSINRFVRIFSNAWMVHLFAVYGLRSVTLAAVIIALLSTAGYAMATGILFWIVLRILWGLSFSALRISTLGYALQQSKPGFGMGLSRSIQETGPLLTLTLTPLLLSSFSHTHTFVILAACSLPALYFAWRLPVTADRTPAVRSHSFISIPSVINLSTFITAFLIDGVVVVALGMLFLHYNNTITPLIATSLAAVYLGYRRICLVLFAPLGGWLADKTSLKLMFNLSWALVIVGLAMMSGGWIETGAIITFTFYSVHAAIAPGYVAAPSEHPLASVAENATWRDIGAAAGTLTGGLLLNSPHLNTLITMAVLCLLLLFLRQSGTTQYAYRFLLLWK
jgi:DHA1 family multidrug resistance protein-like MFS transporter